MRALVRAGWLAIVPMLACSSAAEPATSGEQGATDPSSTTMPDGGSGDGHHAAPARGSDGGAETETPSAPLLPGCDDDNPVTDGALGIDRPLPDAILQFERRMNWNCHHREYHETRQWDYISTVAGYAKRYEFAKRQGWTRAAVQEGAPTSGFDFLAMHRAMVGTLRHRFPEHAALFQGWTAVPQTSTADDPVPVIGDAGAPAAFWDSMARALTRLESDLGSFTSDDELGLYLETQHRPTDADPFARATDGTVGVHTYLHIRFDDPKSAIRMQSFSRNIENQTFFRLHGWIDRIWSDWRRGQGKDDATDVTYGEMMHHACMHMGFMHWDIANHTCH